MKKLATCLIGLMILAGVSTAKEYTLQECIEMAKKTDRNVTMARNAVKTGNDAVWVRAGQFLPSASVSGSYRKSDQGQTSPQVYQYRRRSDRRIAGRTGADDQKLFDRRFGGVHLVRRPAKRVGLSPKPGPEAFGRLRLYGRHLRFGLYGKRAVLCRSESQTGPRRRPRRGQAVGRVAETVSKRSIRWDRRHCPRS